MAHESLAGMTALVTGAAVRIGRALARALAREGAHVILHCRRSVDEAKDAAAEIRDLGVEAWVITADFSRREEYEGLIARATKLAGREIDILINSASIFPLSTLRDITFEDVVLNAEVNAWAPFLLSRELAARGGKRKIINLIDSRITSDDPTHVAYMLSKHLLHALTRMCALEFAPDVTVNGIGPGLILPPPGQDISYIEKLTYTVPLQRHGDESDIAAAAIYLLKSTFVTGTVLFVDGGRHLREYKDGQAAH